MGGGRWAKDSRLFEGVNWIKRGASGVIGSVIEAEKGVWMVSSSGKMEASVASS